MPGAFDYVVMNPGVGGVNVAMDSFTDTDSVVKFMPYGAVSFGPQAGPYTPVETTAGLPVQPQTGATWAVTGTFWQATQPISATSLPLPTDAATETTLSALNLKVTACNTGAVVLAAGTAVIGHVDVDSSALPTGASTAANQSTEITILNGIGTVLSGTLTVAGTVAVSNFPATQPVSGTVTADQGGVWNITNISGTVSLPTGAATSAAQTTGNASLSSIDTKTPALGQALAAGSVPVVLTASQIATLTPLTSVAVTNAGTFAVQATLSAGSAVIGHVIVDSGAITISAALPAGTNVIGHVILDSGTITTVGTVTTLTQWNAGHGTAAAALRVELPTDGTGVVGLNAGSNIVGKFGIDQTTPGTTNAVQSIAGTTGGLLVSSFISTAAVQATAVKASAGLIYGIEFFNITATPVYVRLYDKATTPATTDTPLWRGTVPGNTAGSGFVKSWPQGLVCTSGIGFRCTAGIADNDATVLAASTILGNIEYK